MVNGLYTEQKPHATPTQLPTNCSVAQCKPYANTCSMQNRMQTVRKLFNDAYCKYPHTEDGIIVTVVTYSMGSHISFPFFCPYISAADSAAGSFPLTHNVLH